LNKDDYIKKLERRIHNQRVALRENWQITEMRMADRMHPCYRPLKSRWWDCVMNREKAIEILGKDAVWPDNSLRNTDEIEWYPHSNRCNLDSNFTSEQLKAIVWWMEEYGTKD